MDQIHHVHVHHDRHVRGRHDRLLFCHDHHDRGHDHLLYDHLLFLHDHRGRGHHDRLFSYGHDHHDLRDHQKYFSL